MNILTNQYFTQQLQNNTPTFQGTSRRLQNVIDNCLRKPIPTPEDELLLTNSIKNALRDITVPEKFMGEGTHKKVYKITRKYVARIPTNKKLSSEDLNKPLKIGKGIFRSVTNYFGEAIAELGDFQILKNVGYHVPAGVPEHLSRNASRSKIKKYYINKYLPRFGQLRQGCFDDLALIMNKLNNIKLGQRNFCVFDYLNPNNIVLSKNQLYLVDEINTLMDNSYDNTTAKLFEVLINKATRSMEAPDAGKNTKYVRNIFKKTLLASTKAELCNANSKEDCEFWNTALKKCKINTDTGEVLSDLDKIERDFTNMTDRVEAVKIYITKLFNTNPLINTIA